MFIQYQETPGGLIMFVNEPMIDPVELINVHCWLDNQDPMTEHHSRFNGLFLWKNGESLKHDVEISPPLRTVVWFKDTKEGKNMATYFKMKWC